MALPEKSNAIAARNVDLTLLKEMGIAAKKAMLILLYSMGKISFNMLGKLFNVRPPQVYRWMVKEEKTLPEYSISGEIKEIEFDEMWHFIKRKNKLWVIKAVDRCTGKTVAWALGNRDTATKSCRGITPRTACYRQSAYNYD